MSRADLLKEIADHHYALADLYQQLAGESATASVSAARPAAAAVAAPAIPEGSLEVCPRHRVAYQQGNYGPMCPAKGDDPAWTNKRGYCSINPGNAATYLRNLAAVGA